MPSQPVATGLSPLRSLSGPFILFIALFALSTATPSRPVSGQTGTTSTIWLATEVPSVPADPEVASGELGLRFRSDIDGVIAGIRFYKAPTNTGTHVANLWTGTGTKLATATFTNETASGWQQANFPTRVAVTAGTVYVASYHMNVGHYSDDEYDFTGHGLDRPPLHALADGESGPNGVYATGAASAFPTLGWHASNYWVDVVFIAGTGSSDATPPTVTAFTIPAAASALTVSILGFAATDNVGVTGYLATESASAPSAGAAGWTSSPPATYTFAAAGARTLYGWAKDAAGNVSTSLAASVTITLADTAAPTITAFTMPSTSSALTVAITRFTATDNVAVTGYLVKESSATPSPTASEWTATVPAAYTFATAGSKTLYAWVEDAARNVSARKSASVRITLAASGPEPSRLVRRRHARAPELRRLARGHLDEHARHEDVHQNLAVISLLADMGNGEVQDRGAGPAARQRHRRPALHGGAHHALGCGVALGPDLCPVSAPGARRAHRRARL